MARSWCKVSSSLDSHPRIRRAGNLGRQVFEFALRRNAEIDRNGVVPAEHLEGEYIADVLMLTKEEAVSGLSSCVRTGLLALDNGNYVITGWDDEWGKRPMTEAERKRNQRANKRDSTSVTKCPDSVVTESDCPECHASEERRGEEIRREEKRTDPPKAPQGALVSGSPNPGTDRSERKKRKAAIDATPAELASVRVILDRLGHAAGVAYRGCDAHTRLILRQLRDGITEAELRAVVAYCATIWDGKPEMRKYLRPETLFGPSTISKYIDPARTEYAREISEAAQQDRKLEVVR